LSTGVIVRRQYNSSTRNGGCLNKHVDKTPSIMSAHYEKSVIIIITLLLLRERQNETGRLETERKVRVK